jgi:hypothetical protein
MIEVLQREQEKRGDVEVHLHGAYGACESTFEVMDDKRVTPEECMYLNIWTGIESP